MFIEPFFLSGLLLTNM